MRNAVLVSGLLLIETLLLIVGASGLSSGVPQFVAVGYIAIACMIATPFYVAKRMRDLSSLVKQKENQQ